MTDDMNNTPSEETKTESKGGRWVEEVEVAGRDAVARVQDLIEEGNVRRLILKTAEDKVIFEVPLTAGVVVGAGALALAPMFAAIGAAVAFLARVKIQVVRTDGSDEDDES